ncbi:SpoIIE family protein phosphatase [Agathobacter sp.]
MRLVSTKKIIWGLAGFASTVLCVMGYYPLVPAVYGAYCISCEHTILFYIGLFTGMGYFISIQSICKYLFIIVVTNFGIRLYTWANRKNSCMAASVAAAVSTTAMNLSVALIGQIDRDGVILAFAEGLIVFAAAFGISRAVEYALSFRFEVSEDRTGLLPDREEAFASAAQSLSGIISQANNITVERPADDGGERIRMEITGRLCACCDGCSICWTQENNNMADGIRHLVDAVRQRMKTEDIVKNRYVDNCPHYDRMVEAAIDAFTRLELNEAWYRRLTENRRVIADQLDAMAKLMDDWINAENCIDKKRRMRLAKIMVSTKEAGFIVENAHIYETSRHQICIKADVYTKYEGGIPAVKYVRAVGHAMGMKLRPAQETPLIIAEEIASIVLYEENHFYALSGIATKKKTGSAVSGDSCGMFLLDDGMYNVCISDGMGSGKRAKAESTLVVDLLEKLLEAGFRRDMAVKMMNSTMVISQGEESYSTVDFASIDLYSGELEITKIGAAASFIRRENEVTVIENESLPAGVDLSQETQHTKNTMQSGDFLVMVTDGVLEYLHVKDRQQKLMDIISDVKSDNAGVISQEILDRVLLNTGGYAMDDMTVITIGIWEK